MNLHVLACRLAGILSIAACAIFTPPCCFAQTPDQLHAMFESDQYFALRDATLHTKAPLFYRGAVQASANRRKAAEKILGKVIQAAPHSSEAYEAHGLLSNLYFRNGLYRESYRELQAESVEKPDAADVKNAMPLIKALSEYPDQSVVKRTYSSLPVQGDHLPVRINGLDAKYIFDTGAAISVLSDQEAKRFGLTPRSISTKLNEASGSDVTGVRIAVANDFILGNLHLRNVAFIVLPDTREPFSDVSEEERGILGLPVLLAMRTLRWHPKGFFEFGFSPGPLHLPASNLLFHDNTAVVQVVSQSRPLEFTLDTGAMDTDLNPVFAAAFPDLLKQSGTPEVHSITGVGGTNSYDSVLLPSVTFEVGGRAVTLKPAHVYTKYGLTSWAAGNLGNDLLHQAQTITLDFHSMTLRLQ
jgi:hypothetical protein